MMAVGKYGKKEFSRNSLPKVLVVGDCVKWLLQEIDARSDMVFGM